MELTGTVKAVVFRNSANGWTVLDLFDESGDEHTAVGILPTCHVGEHVTLTGEYVEHPSYGLQFKASAVQSTPPLTVNALENYLSSGLIKGVGKVTAHQIVERFGMNAFDVLQHQPERLLEIAGIGKARANTCLLYTSGAREVKEHADGVRCIEIIVHCRTKCIAE